MLILGSCLFLSDNATKSGPLDMVQPTGPRPCWFFQVYCFAHALIAIWAWWHSTPSPGYYRRSGGESGAVARDMAGSVSMAVPVHFCPKKIVLV